MNAVTQIAATPAPDNIVETIRLTLQEQVAHELEATIHEKIQAEEDRRFRQLKWIVAFIGLIGLGTFGTLANYFIEKTVDARAGHLRTTLELSEVHLLALRIEFKDSFARDDSDHLMALLRRVATNPQIRDTRQFRSTLESVVGAFVAANMGPQLDELFELFDPQLLEKPELVQSLLHHYGQEVVTLSEVGEIAAANSAIVKNFERLERAADRSGIPEVALYYRTLHESARTEDKSNTVVRLIERLSSLRELDLRNYVLQLLIHAYGKNWSGEQTVQVDAIERITARFLTQYSRELAAQLKIPQADIEAWLKDRPSADEARAIADSIPSPEPLG